MSGTVNQRKKKDSEQNGLFWAHVLEFGSLRFSSGFWSMLLGGLGHVSFIFLGPEIWLNILLR